MHFIKKLIFNIITVHNWFKIVFFSSFSINRFQPDERGNIKFTTSFTPSLSSALKLCGEKLNLYLRLQSVVQIAIYLHISFVSTIVTTYVASLNSFWLEDRIGFLWRMYWKMGRTVLWYYTLYYIMLHYIMLSCVISYCIIVFYVLCTTCDTE